MQCCSHASAGHFALSALQQVSSNACLKVPPALHFGPWMVLVMLGVSVCLLITSPVEFVITQVTLIRHSSRSDGSPPQLVESSTCAAPWMDGSSVGLGCLLFSSENAMSWYDADAFCHDQHYSKLISIESAEQQEFVKMVLDFLGGHEEGHSWWTSGTDQGREGEWYWAATLTAVGSFMWHNDQPNEGTDANCLYVHLDGEGYDGPCSSIYFPVCERY